MGLFRCDRVIEGRLDNKVAVITGANSGIGKETAKDFYLRGAKVIIACRSEKRAEEAIAEILEQTKDAERVGEIRFLQLDLASFASIRNAAKILLDTEDQINLLINNAGVFGLPYTKTEDGFEIHFSVNHLGHFLFTCLLLPRILRSTPARIVNVASLFYTIGSIDFNDINLEGGGYNPTLAYCRSKLANILFTKALAERLDGTGVSTYCLCPGAVATNIQQNWELSLFNLYGLLKTNLARKIFFKTPENGAKTIIYCAVDEAATAENGLFYRNERPAYLMGKAQNKETIKRLWEESVRMVNLGEFDPFKKEVSVKENSHL